MKRLCIGDQLKIYPCLNKPCKKVIRFIPVNKYRLNKMKYKNWVQNPIKDKNNNMIDESN